MSSSLFNSCHTDGCWAFLDLSNNVDCLFVLHYSCNRKMFQRTEDEVVIAGELENKGGLLEVFGALKLSTADRRLRFSS